MLATFGALPRELAADLLLQACQGLAVVHAAGIVHRDIKPENLFCVMGERPTLKLLDFGIAQYGPESFPHREVAGYAPEALLIGTPAYMAPERIQDLPAIDQRSDIWSLGVVLHELITARRLFGTKDPTETCARVLRHRFELEADPTVLPPSLRWVIARCLARQPRHRYENVQELADALRAAIAQPERTRGTYTGKFQRHATSAEPSSGTPAAKGPAKRLPSLDSERWRVIGSALSFAALALLVLVAALALFSALTGRSAADLANGGS
jgi:serine/threonine-protein kinase